VGHVQSMHRLVERDRERRAVWAEEHRAATRLQHWVMFRLWVIDSRKFLSMRRFLKKICWRLTMALRIKKKKRAAAALAMLLHAERMHRNYTLQTVLRHKRAVLTMQRFSRYTLLVVRCQRELVFTQFMTQLRNHLASSPDTLKRAAESSRHLDMMERRKPQSRPLRKRRSGLLSIDDGRPSSPDPKTLLAKTQTNIRKLVTDDLYARRLHHVHHMRAFALLHEPEKAAEEETGDSEARTPKSDAPIELKESHDNAEHDHGVCVAIADVERAHDHEPHHEHEHEHEHDGQGHCETKAHFRFLLSPSDQQRLIEKCLSEYGKGDACVSLVGFVHGWRPLDALSTAAPGTQRNSKPRGRKR